MLPGVIARFAGEHPGVELTVRCSFSAGFPQALAEGDLDMAIYAAESARRGLRQISREKTHWVVSRYHSVHQRTPVPIALFDRDCWWRDRALESLEAAEIPYQIVFTSESVTGITAAISAGVAVGMVAESSLRDDFMTLSPKHGFPLTPDSALVLECREAVSKPLSLALINAVKEAFGKA